jgi:hypothetical protein
LTQIAFPAYRLPSKPSEENGVIFFETVAVKTGEPSIRIVDDLKIPKPTLGLRRLLLKKKNVKLYNFKTAVYTLGDLVRLSSPDVVWLDSKGKSFTIPKKTTFQLEFRRITHIFQKVGYVILALEGETQRFRSIYGPPSKAHGVLVMVNGNIRLFYSYALPEVTKKRVRV